MRYEARDEAAPAERALAHTGWAKELRRLCAMLSRSPEDTMAAVSVTVYYGPSAVEAPLLPLLCKYLAAEYGLEHTMTVADQMYTVRFHRRASECAEPETGGGRPWPLGVLERVP